MKTQVIQRKQYFRGDQTKLTVGKLGEPEEQRGRGRLWPGTRW